MTKNQRALVAVNAAIMALDYIEAESDVAGLCDEATMTLLAARQMLGASEWPEIPSVHNNPEYRDIWLESAERQQRIVGVL